MPDGETGRFLKLAVPGARIVLTTHVHPDGDGVGSELGLARFLRDRGALARIVNEVEANLLTFVQIRHACALNGRDMDENIFSAIVRLDKAEALGAVEPLDGTDGHGGLLGCFPFGAARRGMQTGHQSHDRGRTGGSRQITQ